MSTTKTIQLGSVVATPGALGLLEEHSTGAVPFLARHMRGDWGDLCDEDKEANDDAVAHGGRIMSAYHVGSEKLWVITEADRSVTTLLLPSEY